MKSNSFFCAAAAFFILIGCKSGDRSDYAIRDFNKTLQPYLVRIVSTGIVGYDSATRYLVRNATDKELRQLSQSEHPILRAVALRKLLKRPSFDHYRLMMNHLNDTAIVAVDWGEFGRRNYRVSDDMLQNGRWKDSAAKMKTIEEIILKYNYLNSAYMKVASVDPKEYLYASIKKMALRKRNYYENYGEMNFDEIERALYDLAKFKRSDDVLVIKKALLENHQKMSEYSFKLMEEYPNETYMEVFQGFYLGSFYYNVCDSDKFPENAAQFIAAIAVYKNESSVKILKAIFDRKPFMPCSVDTYYIKTKLVDAIVNNKCKAYAQLIKQVKSAAKTNEDMILELPVVPETLARDTAPEPIRWW